MAQGLSTPDPSLRPTHLSIRRGRATTTHYTHHQVSLMVSRNTTLVSSLGLHIGPACEAGLSAGMRCERVPPKGKRKKNKGIVNNEEACKNKCRLYCSYFPLFFLNFIVFWDGAGYRGHQSAHWHATGLLTLRLIDSIAYQCNCRQACERDDCAGSWELHQSAGLVTGRTFPAERLWRLRSPLL